MKPRLPKRSDRYAYCMLVGAREFKSRSKKVTGALGQHLQRGVLPMPEVGGASACPCLECVKLTQDDSDLMHACKLAPRWLPCDAGLRR